MDENTSATDGVSGRAIAIATTGGASVTAAAANPGAVGWLICVAQDVV